MHRHLPVSAAAIAALASAAFAQDAPDAEVRTIDLGEGVYALITDRAGNVGVSVGEDGVFMIDTQFEPLAPLLDAAQREISGADVDTVLNTHWHYDHVRGNAYFSERGAEIIAHENVKPRLTTPGGNAMLGNSTEPLGEAYLPTREVEGDFSMSLNGETLNVYFEPDAHTDGDLWVHFVKADVIHAGDLLFSGFYPFIDISAGGTVDGFIAGMEQIVETAGPDTQIISGHGPISRESDLEASIAMLREGKARVQALVDEGMTLEQVVAAEPLADFHEEWNWGFITTERMVTTFYWDITGALE